MATKTFYATNTLLGAASPKWGEFSETSPGATATSSPATGWTTGTATPTKYKDADMAEKRSAPTGSTAMPNTTINDGGGTNRSGWRSKEKLTVTFEAGTWIFNMVCRAVTAANTGKQAITLRVWKGSNEEGTGATLLNETLLTGSEMSSLSKEADQNSKSEWSAPEVALSNEYLFVECAVKIVAAGGGSTQDCVFRYGNEGVRLVTANVKESGGSSNTPLALLL